MTNEPFLSSAEEWLFKEVELLYELHSEIRSTHLKYQSWFMLAHGVLLAAIINVRMNDKFIYVIDMYYIICVVGLVFGRCFWLLQWRHIQDADGRMKRIREICGKLRKPIKSGEIQFFEFMSYVGGDMTLVRKWKWLSYSRIRLVVDSVFPLLWFSLLLMGTR